MAADLSRVEAIWVDTEDALEEAVARCGRVVALDTEFQRTSTFYPLPGLYQMASDGQIWLIDPLAIERYDAFVDLLEDRRVVKVMHACAEDLELLRHHLGVTPNNLFDTQLAHAFLSERYSISHAHLVEEHFGIELPSSQTRSNWLKRPLSPGQLRYAADDVRYLPELQERMATELANSGRLDWFWEDMDRFGRYEMPDPEAYYQGVSKAWTLSRPQLARLQSLCAWRERTAMSRNVPRKRVVWDEHLFELARLERVSEDDVERRLPGAVGRRYGEALVLAHTQPAEEVPPVSKPLTPGDGKMVRRLKEVGVELASRMGVAVELLGRKRDLERLIRHFRDNGSLDMQHSGWRREIVGEAYLELLHAGGAR